MKRILIITMAVAVMFAAGNILAGDYSQYSTEELAGMRGTLRTVTQEEREAFRAEWQNRVQNMTREERQKYAGRPENAGQGQGKMMQQRKRIQQENSIQGRNYGMGSGSGMRGGRGRR